MNDARIRTDLFPLARDDNHGLSVKLGLGVAQVTKPGE